MVHITKRIGLDNVIVGRINDSSIDYNDESLQNVIDEIVCTRYITIGNLKKKASLLDRFKEKLFYPYQLVEHNVEFEIYGRRCNPVF